MLGKTRIQLDLPDSEARDLDALRDQCGFSSRSDLVRAALAVTSWVLEEKEKGRRVFAVGGDDVSWLDVPGLTQSRNESI